MDDLINTWINITKIYYIGVQLSDVQFYTLVALANKSSKQEPSNQEN